MAGAATGAAHGTRRGGYGSAIAGGVFLVGLGMLILTGWWWPGMIMMISLALATELARRSQIAAAATTFIAFAAIPVGMAVITVIHVPWVPVGTFVLIALGLLSLTRATSGTEGIQK